MRQHTRSFTVAISFLLIISVLTPPTRAAVGMVNNDSALGNKALQQPEPVTLYLTSVGDFTTLDPQKVPIGDNAITPIENLFLGLTDLDPKTNEVRPEAATEWTHNATGDVWTFKLRDDIPWVQWDPKTKKATEIRKVTAADFEYGIKRSCDPRVIGKAMSTGSPLYVYTTVSMIKGCGEVLTLKAGVVKDSDLDRIGVKAISDTQLEITTLGPKPSLLSISGVSILRAVPKEIVSKLGDRWTDPGNLVTNGPFVLDTRTPNTQSIFLRNPLYPKGVNDEYGGNIERVIIRTVRALEAAQDLYLKNQIDLIEMRGLFSPGPNAQIMTFLYLRTVYFGFAYDKPPFDKVEVRRAFSAAIDRKALTKQVWGIPIAHFMPPGIHGAVPLTEVGVGKSDNLGFDPEYAKQQLAAAGYPECKNFPTVTFAATRGAAKVYGGILQDMVKQNLGCDAAIITIKEATNILSLVQPTTATAQRPHIFYIGWDADYPDAENWMLGVLSCQSPYNSSKRPCTDAIDKKIGAASQELDDAKRQRMYRDLEEAFFGENGEFPIAPLHVLGVSLAAKPWYTGFLDTDGKFGGKHWNTQQIDQTTQLATRNSQTKK